jgi:hypothetical protein
MAKTVIKKGAIRKIKTADYEQLDIIVEEQEEIEWDSSEDRESKINEFQKRFINDLEITYNEVVQKFGVNRCMGTVRTTDKDIPNSSSDIDLDF